MLDVRLASDVYVYQYDPLLFFAVFINKNMNGVTKTSFYSLMGESHYLFILLCKFLSFCTSCVARCPLDILDASAVFSPFVSSLLVITAARDWIGDRSVKPI